MLIPAANRVIELDRGYVKWRLSTRRGDNGLRHLPRPQELDDDIAHSVVPGVRRQLDQVFTQYVGFLQRQQHRQQEIDSPKMWVVQVLQWPFVPFSKERLDDEEVPNLFVAKVPFSRGLAFGILKLSAYDHFVPL